jgi:DNA-binding MarR family transcriptional regulator
MPSAEDSVDRHVREWQVELPDLDPALEGLVTRMQQIVKLLERRYTEVIERHGITSQDYWVLHALRRRGEPYTATPSALAADVGLSPAAMTGRLDRLVRHGLVSRTTDARDRRRVLIALQPAGHAMWEATIADQAAVEESAFEVLSHAEVSRTSDLLRRVLVPLEQATGTRRPGTGTSPAPPPEA